MNNDTESMAQADKKTTLNVTRFFLVILLSVLSIISVLMIPPASFPLVTLRWIFGLLMLLWMPGYCFVQMLFADKSVEAADTIILSVALSLLFVIIVTLIFNFTPVGLSEMAVIVSLVAISIVFSIIALLRQVTQPSDEALNQNDAEVTSE